MADGAPAQGGHEGFLRGEASIELSSNNTALSLERSRLGADRTLMSVIRTALSLISFGFTIFQFFAKAAATSVAVTSGSARRFGMALVLLGIGMLIAGLFSHARMLLALRDRRGRLLAQGLLRPEPEYHTSPTAVIAVLLLLLGLVCILGMVIRAGQFR